ncbi:ABC transporter substrate-binding protein [Aeromicrobium sp.]|uniref:ABC transporter substrate-binding protein n=1 Tax=Aeromicrobium sp. TaxID=1871063 RepID=UPI0019A2E7D3|nr:ABC transporter substrate-binding protein [Aeromicrobium sp.]MBC7630972.1 ABC transporter substrate-binding protein [Aeromicrobium sp.]
MSGSLARKRTVMVVVLAATTLTACSSSGGASSDSSEGLTAVGYNGAALKKAAGDGVKFGFVNQVGAATGDFAQAGVGTKIAQAYINDELGGIDGRPMDIDECLTDGTPEKSQSCANKLIGNKVLSVMTGVDLGAPAAVPIYESAKIPLTFGAPIQAKEYTSGNAFYSIGASPVQVPAVARFIKDKLGAKTVISIGTDAPSGVSSYKTFIEGPLQKLGVVSGFVGAPAGTADFATQAQQAVSKKPDAIVLLVGPQDCTKLIKALQGAGSKIPAVGTGSCVVPELFTQNAAAGRGMYFTGETQQLQQLPVGEETKKFLYAHKKYSGEDESKVDAFTLLGFQSTMNLWELSNKIGVEKLTSESIPAFMKATKNQHNWLATPYTCDGPPVADFPAICHTDATFYQFDGKSLVDVGSFVGIDLL